jgi:hypothetical protein
MEPLTFAVLALLATAFVGAGVWARRNPRIEHPDTDPVLEDEWSNAIR